MINYWVATLAAIACLASPIESFPQAEATFTNSRVNQIFPPNCWFCHGWLTGKSVGYYMGTYAGLMDGVYVNGKRQQLIIPGDSEDSILVKRIEGRILPRMPLDRPPLSDSDISDIRKWIDQGAKPDAGTIKEHELTMDHIRVEKEGHIVFLSCRAPRDDQDMNIRVKIVDEATGKVVAQDWPTSERDLKGLWSQWSVKIPERSMKLPGSVAIKLYVALNGVVQDPSKDYDSELDGVIFLLDNKETPDSELLRQAKLVAHADPKTPPHKIVNVKFQLETASDVSLAIYPEKTEKSVYEWSERDIPADRSITVHWNLTAPGLVRSGWYNARIRATSTIPGQFQPDLAVLFQVNTGR